jgi:uncharacterized membrane protein YbhN (UPF0104 family)
MTEQEDKQKSINWKGVGKFVLKLLISVAALYYISRKIDFKRSLELMADAHIGWLLLALLVFNGSKIISTLRVKSLLQRLEIIVSHNYNIRLYYVGAFYNLFLPGSIGGDGYKVYLLKSRFETKVKSLISVMLLDRMSGMAALVFLAALLALGSSYEGNTLFQVGGIGVAVLVFPAFYVFSRFVFKKYLPSFGYINVISFFVQLSQLFCAWLLLNSMGLLENQMDYLCLFMIAAAVSVIPFTIGGLGARELVFVVGQDFLNIDTEKAVAYSILFFCITIFSGLVGWVFSWSIDKKATS